MATNRDILNAAFAAYDDEKLLNNANNYFTQLRASGFERLLDKAYTVDDSTTKKTGLFATTWKNKTTGEYIIAFRGTEGQLSDFSADANLGWPQWDRNRSDIQSLVDKVALESSSKVIITGHSLGGALAQFAAFDFATRKGSVAGSEISVATWNSLGGAWGLGKNIPGYNSSLLKDRGVSARHFFNFDDLVARLGGPQHLAGIDGDKSLIRLPDGSGSFDKIKTRPIGVAHGWDALSASIEKIANAENKLPGYLNVAEVTKDIVGSLVAGIWKIDEKQFVPGLIGVIGSMVPIVKNKFTEEKAEWSTAWQDIKSVVNIALKEHYIPSKVAESNFRFGKELLSGIQSFLDKYLPSTGSSGELRAKAQGEQRELPMLGKLADAAGAGATKQETEGKGLGGGMFDSLDKFREAVKETFEDIKDRVDGLSMAEIAAGLSVALGKRGLQMGSDKYRIDLRSENGAVILDLTLKPMSSRGMMDVNPDFGLNGLIEIKGKLQAKVEAGLQTKLSFGWDDAGFFVNTATKDTPEFQIGVNATLANTSFNAEVFNFLNHKVSDKPDAKGVSSNLGAGFLLDIVEPSGDGKLRLAELGSARIEPSWDGKLDLNLGLQTDLGTTNLPSVRADLNVDWSLKEGGLPVVQLTNAKLNFGEFVNGFARQVLGNLAPMIDGVRRVTDILTKPISILNSVGLKDVSLLDIAYSLGKIDEGGYKFVKAVAAAASFAGKIREIAAAGEIDLGSFQLENPFKNLNPKTGKLDLNLGVDGKTLAAGISGLAGLAASSPGLQNKGADDFMRSYASFTGGGFRFPLLENPKSAIQLLMGRDIDLFVWDLPKLKMGFSLHQTFPVLGPIAIGGGIRLEAGAQMGIGFDTSGLRKYITFPGSDKPEGLILQGLHLRQYPGYEVSAGVGIEVKGGVDIGIASAWIGAGIYGTLGLDLRDPNGDGRLNLWEIGRGPGKVPSIFKFGGKIEAGVFAELSIGFGFFKKEWRWERRITLIEFGESDNNPTTTESILKSDGTIFMSASGSSGPIPSDSIDVADQIQILAADGTIQIWAGVFSETLSGTPLQTWNNANIPIKADLRAGDDRFSARGDKDGLFLGTAKNFTISGGLGNDRIETGAGKDSLAGAAGDDKLLSGGGDDSLMGEAGHDELEGGAGKDTMVGDAPADTLGGNDLLKGGDGDDSLLGGSGADILEGGADNDELFGGSGADELIGDEGDDKLAGGDGGDFLYGGNGNNILWGGNRNGASENTNNRTEDPNIYDDVFDASQGVNKIFGGMENGSDAGFDVVSYRHQEIRRALEVFELYLDPDQPANNRFVPRNVQMLANWLDGRLNFATQDGIPDSAIVNRILMALEAPFQYGEDEKNHANEIEKLKSILALSTRQGVRVDLDNGKFELGAEGDLLLGIEQLEGTDLGDTLRGNGSDNVLIGNAGNDTLIGLDGFDYLEGGEGADYLDGDEDAEGAEDSPRDALLRKVNEFLAEGDGLKFDGKRLEAFTDPGELLVFLENAGPSATPANATDEQKKMLYDNAVTYLDLMARFVQLSGFAGENEAMDYFRNAVRNPDFIDRYRDTASYESSPLPVRINLLARTASGGDAEGDRLLNIEAIHGSHYSDFLQGDQSDNFLRGDRGDDTLIGGGGDDCLDGGQGRDSIIGGDGNDLYFVTSREDTIVESDGTLRGYDEVRAAISYTLQGGIENLRLMEAAAPDYDVKNWRDNHSTSGEVTVVGGAPKDQVLEPNRLSDVLENGSPRVFALSVTPDASDLESKTLRVQGVGLDSLFLGAGIFGRGIPQGAKVTAIDSQKNIFRIDKSIQEEEVSSAFIDLADTVLIPSWAVGNAADNLVIGNSEKNTLLGMDGSDRLLGMGGNDFIDGGKGRDVMEGGMGNDTFRVDDPIEVVIEVEKEYLPVTRTLQDGSTQQSVETVSGGEDTVLIHFAANYLTFDLSLGSVASAVEILRVGNDRHTYLVGNKLKNSLFGGVGNDKLIGGTLGSDDSDGDYLDGGSGIDRMAGGRGDDTYVVDSEREAATIEERRGEGNNDQVNSWVSWDLSRRGKGDITEFEHLKLEEALDQDGRIRNLQGFGTNANNSLTGNSGNNVLGGFAGDDALRGGAGDDTLLHGYGNDALDGGAGYDSVDFSVLVSRRMFAAGVADNAVPVAGSDTLGNRAETRNFNIDLRNAANGSVTISKNSAIPFDEKETISFVESIKTGAGQDTFRGGVSDERFEGGGGNDSVVGGGGRDTLIGGEGNDVLTAGDERTKPSYLYVSGAFDWIQARNDATTRGGHLAAVTSLAEWNEMISQAGSFDGWLGATDDGRFVSGASEGNWRWVTGEAWTYSLWAGGEPNNWRESRQVGGVFYLKSYAYAMASAYKNAGKNVSVETVSVGSLGGWKILEYRWETENFLHAKADGKWNDLAGWNQTDFSSVLRGYYLEIPPVFSQESTVLDGGAGSDTLQGGDAGDFLDGGAGFDILRGNKGNDTYVVDDESELASLSENESSSLGGGIDEIRSKTTLELGSIFHKGSTALIKGQWVTTPSYTEDRGTSIENVILEGENDADIRIVTGETNNKLTGNRGKNALSGGGGNDTLNGIGVPDESGAKTFTTYRFIAGDFSWEEAKENAEELGGHLATITSLPQWTEMIAQAGSFAGWLGASDDGNAIPGAREGDWRWLTGEKFSDLPFTAGLWEGGGPDNKLETIEYTDSNGQKQIIQRNSTENFLSTQAGKWGDLAGANQAIFWGDSWKQMDVPPSFQDVRRGFYLELPPLPVGGARDTLAGGIGDDYYRVKGRAGASQEADLVQEQAGNGLDTVLVSTGTSYTMPENVEVLALEIFHPEDGAPVPATAFEGRGTTVADRIYSGGNANLIGDAGNDSLIGGGGRESLIGGDGSDSLVSGTDASSTRFGVVWGDFTWNSAKADAERRGGKLAMIKTAEDQEILEQVLKYGLALHSGAGAYLAKGLWLGATDSEAEGEWKWIDGTSFWKGNAPVDSAYSKWASGAGQPDNANNEDALGLFLRGYPGSNLPLHWNDYRMEIPVNDQNQSEMIGYVIQFDGALAGHATLRGGAQDDRYVLRSPGDRIVEGIDGGANDTATYDPIGRDAEDAKSIALPDYLENFAYAGGRNLKLTASSNMLSENATGGSIATGLGADLIDISSLSRGKVTVSGNSGNDTYIVGSIETTLYDIRDAGGSDWVISGASVSLASGLESLELTGSANLSGEGNLEDNFLYGNAGNNLLRGFEGFDLLDAKAGRDTLIGGAGNDTYWTIGPDDTVTEALDGGTDTIETDISLTLPDHVENLMAFQVNASTPTLFFTGNNLPNILRGNLAANTLVGLGGDDELRGELGADSMIGGLGDDTYYVYDLNDKVVEKDGEGFDTIVIHGVSNYVIPAFVENVVLHDGGTTAEATLRGNNLPNSLGYSEQIFVSTGVYLDGGGGGDTLIGGQGSDTFVVDSQGDMIFESENIVFDTDPVDPPETEWNIETLSVSKASNSLQISRLRERDLVRSSIDFDLVSFGGTTEDLELVANSEALTGKGNSSDNKITGNEKANTLLGGKGDDTLDGRQGVDSLVGGEGDDRYILDSTADILVESGQDANDGVVANFSIDLGSEKFSKIENLALSGAANLSGKGSALDNSLIGNTGRNTLLGMDGDDFLDGGSGIDSLVGGLGADTYFVDSASDIVLEGDFFTAFPVFDITGGGIQVSGTSATVHSANHDFQPGQRVVFAGSPLAAFDGREYEVLSVELGKFTIEVEAGTGSDLAAKGRRVQRVDDVLTDLVISTATYTLSANTEILSLAGGGAIDGTGNASDNILSGNAAGNLLDGMSGLDTLIGGAGNDTYVVDQFVERLVESKDEGTDLVRSFGSFMLLANVENLTLLDRPGLAGATNGEGASAIGNSLTNSLTGNNENNLIDGAFGAMPEIDSSGNVVMGFAGNDTLNGGGGTDTMRGGKGNNTYVVNSPKDVVEEAGPESDIDGVLASVDFSLAKLKLGSIENVTLSGGVAVFAEGNMLANRLRGNAIGNSLLGAEGNDTLDGAAGADTLAGGTGHDLYVVDNPADQLVEVGNAGIDTVQSSVTFTLGAHLDHLVITGKLAVHGTGNSLDNSLIGNLEANSLSGADGNDTLDGGTGADTMAGGAGNDWFVVENAQDRPVEASGGGSDTVTSRITHTLGANLEDLILAGSGAVHGTGNSSNNRITGNSSANTLRGEGGHDTMEGGAGIDTMIGGSGDDFYTVDSAKELVVEAANSGQDTVQSPVSLTLGAHLENLILTGEGKTQGTGNSLNNKLVGNNAANILTGGAGSDTLDGRGGNDRLVGGEGDDIYLLDTAGDVVVELLNEGVDTVQTPLDYTLGAQVENLILLGAEAIRGTGNSLNNSLTGNAASNTLSGAAGNDTLNGLKGDDSIVGGAGDDVYFVDSEFDIVVEYWNSGIDQIHSSATHRLAANVENLSLLGGARLHGTGNALPNRLEGNSGANSLDGGSGADTLLGGTGADTLIGGAGNDSMAGGAGNDMYFVDVVDDLVIEAMNEGIDTVSSRVSLTLSTGIDDLVLTGSGTIHGTGNELNNNLAGNSLRNSLAGGLGNDTLDGGGGVDSLIGGGGDDFYLIGSDRDVVTEIENEGSDTVFTSITHTLGANVEHLVLTGAEEINGSGNSLDNNLTGNSAANFLSAGTGRDTLDGGGGRDTLAGGLGDDFYIVDSADDVIVEGGAGIDRVRSFDTHILRANVELLELAGNGAIHGYGNALNNSLFGNGAANSLEGGGGFDTLDGGAGIDTLIGGAGNDIYVVDDTAELILEVENEGTDLVQAQVSFSLSANVENLLLTGNAGIHGIGNNLNNQITGNESANSLIGGTGRDSLNGGFGHDTLAGSLLETDGGRSEIDTLTGGSGMDVFVLGRGNTRFYDEGISGSSGRADYALITDFTVGQDKLQLDGAKGNYFLGASGVANITGSGLFHDSNANAKLDSTDELIAIIRSANSTQLITANTVGEASFV